MTYQFCTLFDSLYLSRALVMYDSLKKSCSNFHLYIFPFDDTTKSILETLQLDHVTIVSMTEFENKELLSVKPTRTKGEYCWTCTPSIIFYCIDHFKLDHCTYIDADLYFFSDPGVLVDEMGNDSVLITEHRYTKRYDQSKLHGIYCVQFITFKGTPDGMAVLTWWRDRCLEWCYARREDGKFGDQKYLDDWTTRFNGVHVLRHEGGGVAPWNVQRYDITSVDGSLYVKKDIKLVFYHFHYTKLYDGDMLDLGNYKFSENAIRYIYSTYISYILDKEDMLLNTFQFKRRTQSYIYINKLLTPLHRVARMLLGVYNVYPIDTIKNGRIN